MDSDDYILIKVGILSNIYLHHYSIIDQDTYNTFMESIGLERSGDKLCTIYEKGHEKVHDYYRYHIINKHLFFTARIKYGI